MTHENDSRSWTVTAFVAASLLIATAVMAGDASAAKTKKPTGYAAVPWGATEKQLRETLNLKDEWDCMDLHDVRHCTTSFETGIEGQAPRTPGASPSLCGASHCCRDASPQRPPRSTCRRATR
jgi:hypothetical protein